MKLLIDIRIFIKNQFKRQDCTDLREAPETPITTGAVLLFELNSYRLSISALRVMLSKCAETPLQNNYTPRPGLAPPGARLSGTRGPPCFPNE